MLVIGPRIEEEGMGWVASAPTPEQIIRKLREAEVALAQGQTTAEKLLTEQALDNAILKEAASGNF